MSLDLKLKEQVLMRQMKVIDNEPRIRDLDLATNLGYTDLHEIRGLIRTLTPQLSKLGIISVVATEIIGAGRPGKEYWLNEPQACLVCASARTPRAAEFRLLLVRVFMMYRHGLAVPQPSLETTIVNAQMDLFQATIFAARDNIITSIGEKIEISTKQVLAAQAHEIQLVEAVSSDVSEIKNTQAYRRVDVSADTLELHIRCLHERRRGICPCCETTQILDERGVKLANFVIDHFCSRKNNKATATWPVCAACNQNLEDEKFKTAHHTQFESYQFALGKVIEGDKWPLLRSQI